MLMILRTYRNAAKSFTARLQPVVEAAEGARRRWIERSLATIPGQLNPEALVAHGDPAEELAKVVRDRNAGLVVMGLHGSPMLGPRMGSVTYRLLCLSPVLVLALPPVPVTASDGGIARESKPAVAPSP